MGEIKNWTERTILDKFLPISQKKYPNFFDYRTWFWSPNRQFWSNCAQFLWAGSTLAIIRGEIKKLDWANPFGQSFTYFQKKLSELFRSPNIVLDTKSSILVQLFSFLVGSLHFSHNWGGNKKLDWANHFGQSFTYFQKKLSELFRSPNIVLDTKSSILDQLCSFLVDSLHFSRNWGGNKKLDWANHFGQSFTYFQKKLSELFRSPNIVLDTKLSILVQLFSFLVGSLHFSHN